MNLPKNKYKLKEKNYIGQGCFIPEIIGEKIAEGMSLNMETPNQISNLSFRYSKEYITCIQLLTSIMISNYTYGRLQAHTE